MVVLYPPVFIALAAFEPSAIFEVPLVRASNVSCEPTAMLSFPVTTAPPIEPLPIPILPLPVVKFVKAAVPTAVLAWPVVMSCKLL
jgi:hypothetical protein